MDTITIANLLRPGGPSSQKRHSVDFIINGKSLYEITGAKKHDLCGRFSSDLPDWNRISSRAFLQEGDPDDGLLDDGQFMIFVCPECADLGCGAIICTIERAGNEFTWRDFAYDNGWGEGMPEYESYAHIGPFHFSEADYRRAIDQATNTEGADGRE